MKHLARFSIIFLACFLSSCVYFPYFTYKNEPYKVLVADYKLEHIDRDNDIVIVERLMKNGGRIYGDDVCENELIYMEIYYHESYVRFYCK